VLLGAAVTEDAAREFVESDDAVAVDVHRLAEGRVCN
jgi:hypothetical protein